MSAVGPGDAVAGRAGRGGAAADGRAGAAPVAAADAEAAGSQGVVILVLLIGLAILFLYPFDWLDRRSVQAARRDLRQRASSRTTGPGTSPARTSASPDPQKLFNVAPVGRWMWNSIWISGLGALLTTFVERARSRSHSRTSASRCATSSSAILLGTMMLPGEVTMIPVYLLWNKIGHFTLEHPWLPHIGTGTQYPLWVPNMFGSAFYIFLQRQFFLGIPRDYFEAARMDGDSYFSMFRRIALPLAKPALIVTFIFEVQAKWFDLITPLIYLRDQALFTAPLGHEDPARPLQQRRRRRGRLPGDHGRDAAARPADDRPLRRVPEVLHPRDRGPGTKGSGGVGGRTGRRRRLPGRTCASRPVLGLDIGGTKIAAGVVDADGGVQGFVVAPTDAARGPADGLARLFELGRERRGERRRRGGTRSRGSGSAAAARSTRRAAS